MLRLPPEMQAAIWKAGLCHSRGCFVLAYDGHCVRQKSFRRPRSQACSAGSQLPTLVFHINSCSFPVCFTCCSQWSLFTTSLLWPQEPFIFNTLWLFLFVSPASQYWSVPVLRPLLFFCWLPLMALNTSVCYFLIYVSAFTSATNSRLIYLI